MKSMVRSAFGAATLLLLVPLWSCTTSQPIRSYEGERLPPEKVATLVWKAPLYVIQIDGTRAPRLKFAYSGDLLPGLHRVIVCYLDAPSPSSGWMAVDFKAEAGKEYKIGWSTCDRAETRSTEAGKEYDCIVRYRSLFVGPSGGLYKHVKCPKCGKEYPFYAIEDRAPDIVCHTYAHGIWCNTKIPVPTESEVPSIPVSFGYSVEWDKDLKEWVPRRTDNE